MFKAKRPLTRPLILLLILASFLLAGCAGQTNNQNWPGLSTDGETAYVAFGSAVAAYNTVTQQESWIYKSENNSLLFFAPPSVQDGRVVLGDYGAAGGMFSPTIIVSVYGFAETGNPTLASLWTNDALAKDKIVAGPLQVGDVAYVGTADFNVLALDANTGAEIWRFETNGAIWGQPTYHEGVLYVSSLDKHVYALDAETGAELWRSQLNGAASAKPLLNPDIGILYAGVYDNALHALDMKTGEEVWQVDADDWIWSAPALSDGVIYFADSSAQVYAADAETGNLIWQKPVNEMRTADGALKQVEGVIQASPIVMDDILYIASEGNRETEEGLLVALDKTTGDEIWQRTTIAPLLTTPVIAGEAIIIALTSEEATLQAFNLENGNQIWSYVPNLE
ncbi:MAG: PQQ-binding-like beta-propeller repeat protein [Chloroflexi bacterium]|nr:PQQ-binding-like beta-propeller repeat protein [Chloroflexota bacterium]